MTFPTLYADWPDGSRRTYGWAALILLIPVSYLLSSIPILIGTMIWMVSSMSMEEISDPAAVQAVSGQLPPLEIFFPMLLAQFILWGGITFFWLKVFERRSLASIGLQQHRWKSRFGTGLLYGIGLVVLLGVSVFLISLVFPESTGGEELAESMDFARLGAPGILPLFLAISVFFLIQGGMEEVIFRGWLMSTLVARWGTVAGVLLSTVGFALLHAQLFLTGFETGLVGMTGIFFTGLFFALLALYQRSIWGAIAAHGGFNATAILGPVSGALASQPELTPSEAVMTVFEQATGMTGTGEVGPASFVQAVVFALLSLFMLWRLKKRAA